MLSNKIANKQGPQKRENQKISSQTKFSGILEESKNEHEMVIK